MKGLFAGPDGMLFLCLVLFVVFVGLLFWALALGMALRAKRLENAPNRAAGRIVGLLHAGVWQRKTYGNVPDGAIYGYGVTGGVGYGCFWNEVLFRWFPCVEFTDDTGRTRIRIMGEGVAAGTWSDGQAVTVAYDPKYPARCTIVGDPSHRNAVYTALGFGVLCMLAALALVGWLALRLG